MTLHAKIGIPDLQRYPLNLRQIIDTKELCVFIYQLKGECTLAHSVTIIPRKYRVFYVQSGFQKFECEDLLFRE